jgi:hypothetical protein
MPAALLLAVFALLGTLSMADAVAAPLRAGAAKVDVTNTQAGPANDPLFAKALVLSDGATTVVIATVDAVAIGEIGPLGNDYLGNVRARIQQDLGIPPANVLVNASHCHGRVCADADQRTVQAVKQAFQAMVPVAVGAGAGHEDRIMENRRLQRKDGREIDVRHAYSLPPDEEIAGVGPIDPEIGVLRLDGKDGRTVAVVYNFACHPIHGVPSGENTADLTGFASRVIEDNLSEGTIAIFLQGCAGDVNPLWYKDVDHPRDAEPLGNTLGLSTLRALRKVRTREDDRLKVLQRVVELPRADLSGRITAMEAEQDKLVRSFRGTSLNLKTFIPLIVKYQMSGEFPSNYAHRYLHERAMGRTGLDHLDAENRANMEQYIHNIHTMEELTRLQTNLALLRKHQATNQASAKKTIDVELTGLRVGDFVLLTFPGELTVQTGLNVKEASPHELTFVAAYTNGYIYYVPTAQQLRNRGGAQEDSDCLVAPEWQPIFEKQAAQMLHAL